jgi:hypothetical protein
LELWSEDDFPQPAMKISGNKYFKNINAFIIQEEIPNGKLSIDSSMREDDSFSGPESFLKCGIEI